ncbi:MAG: hypothetical protein P1U34_00735 [Coxiellaceae bacterium]|nr:hypothetical protein [Coxiellaceae bacterium]
MSREASSIPEVVVHVPMSDFFATGVVPGRSEKEIVTVLSKVEELLGALPEDILKNMRLVLSGELRIDARPLSYKHAMSYVPEEEQPYMALNGVADALRERFRGLDLPQVVIRSNEGKFFQLYIREDKAPAVLWDYFSHGCTLLPSGVTELSDVEQANIQTQMDVGEVLELSSTPSPYRRSERIKLPVVGALDEIEVEKTLMAAHRVFETGGTVDFWCDLDDSLLLKSQSVVTGRTVLNPVVLDFARRLRRECSNYTHLGASFKMRLITSRKLPDISQTDMNTSVSQWINGEMKHAEPSLFSLQSIIETMPDDLKHCLVHACPHTEAVRDGEAGLSVYKRDVIARHYTGHSLGRRERDAVSILADDSLAECAPWTAAQQLEFTGRGITFHALKIGSQHSLLPGSKDSVSNYAVGVISARSAPASPGDDSVLSALRQFSVTATTPASTPGSTPRMSVTPVSVRA